MTTIASTPPVNLTVQFGNQARTKCPDCRCFMAGAETEAACGRCGVIYDRLPDGRFRKRVGL